MTIFDFTLIIILFAFIWFGFWFGIIQAIGALVGIIVGIYAAKFWYIQLANWALFLFGNNPQLAQIICFLIIFIITDRLVGFIFYLINKIFKILSLLPFLKSINHLGGAVLGFIEGVFVLGLILFAITSYPFWPVLNRIITNSSIAHYLITVAGILKPLLPEILKKVTPWLSS